MLDRHRRHTRGGLTRLPRPISATIATALLLALCGGAAAATSSHVVPPNGKVAGKGYSYYLERGWKVLFFGASGPCQTATVGGLRVAMVNPSDGPTCNEPAGRPIYVSGPGSECSTLPGDHNGYGKTPSQLKQCARAGLKGFSDVRASVDGQRVPQYARFITATDVFAFRVPKNRFPGIKQRKGRSAAYGYGLLLMGLAKGTHKVQHTVTLNGKRFSVAATLRVR